MTHPMAARQSAVSDRMLGLEITQLHRWAVERDGNCASINTVPEPRWVDFLRSRSHLFAVAWRQLFRLSPLDLRPAFASRTIRRDSNATLLFALAYLELTAAGDHAYANQLKESLDRVLALRSAKVRHFGVRQNNRMYMKLWQADEDDVSPLLTAWAGRVFLRAFRYTGDSQYLAYASSVARFFLEEHPREERPEGVYFYYDPSMSETIFNASGEISSFLIEYGALASHREATEMGRRGLSYLIANQNADGSWFYGVGRPLHYIDNFHTAFVLSSIASATGYWRAPKVSDALSKGLTYFTTHLFSETPDGLRPIHFDSRFRPLNSNLIQAVDLRDSTASVILFLQLAAADRGQLATAERILHWALKHMRTRHGTYCPEITVLWKNKIPYVDFQAWMLYCLARYKHLTSRSLCHA